MKFSKAITGIDRSGSFRVYLGVTTDAVQQAHELHGTSPMATQILGRALTGTAIFGVMLREPGFKVTMQFKGDGPAQQVLCTADSDGHVKGYIAQPMLDIPVKENGLPNIGGALGKGMLTCIRDAGTTEPYVGKVDLVSGEIAEDMSYYFMVSEQQKTLVSLGVQLDDNGGVFGSAGMIVQVLPDALDEAIDALEQWMPLIPQLSSIAGELSENASEEDIDSIMRELLSVAFDGMPEEFAVDPMDILDLGWKCDCSEERIEQVLMSLGSRELGRIIEEDGQAEVSCQFCGKAYHFDKEHLQKLRLTRLHHRMN